MFRVRFYRFFSMTLLVAALGACGGNRLHFAQEGASEAAPPEIERERFVDRIWSHGLKASFSAETNVIDPAIHGEVVAVAGPQGYVALLDSTTGETRWSVDLDMPITSGVGADDVRVIVAGGEGAVIALSAADGSELWRSVVGGEVLARPVVADDVIIVRVGDNRVVGLSSIDGAQRWIVQKKVSGLSVRGVSDPLLNGRGVVVGLADGRLIAVGIDDGDVLWESAIGRRSGSDRVQQLADIDADPTLFGTILYVASFQSRIVAMALGSPRVIWSQDMSTLKNMAVDQDRLYVVAEDGVLLALNRYNGDLVWRQEALKGRGLSPVVSSRGELFTGDYEGVLYRLNAVTGELLAYNKSSGGAIVGSPLLHQDKVLVLRESGRVELLQTNSP